MFEVWLVCAVTVFAVGVVIFLATRPRHTPGPYHQRLRIEPRADFSIREGLAPGETHPRWKDHETFPAQKVVRLSARELERVNIQRKLADRRPLTRGGFTHGLAAAPQGQSAHELFFWLLVYESNQPGHYSHRCAIDAGITVQPDQPFNGLGGSYAGAGASGSWGGVPDPVVTDTFHNPQPGDRQTFEANAIPDRDPPGYMAPNDLGYTSTPAAAPAAPAAAPAATPDATPSYSAPDTSSSYSSPDVSASVDAST